MWLLPRPLVRRRFAISVLALSALTSVASVGLFGSQSFAAQGDPTLADRSSCPEYTDSVVRLYSAYFLRAPDDEGFRYWATVWGSGDRDLPSISNHFAGSTEFDILYGGLSDGAFVDLVYQNVLGRRADPGGTSYWTRRLTSGMTRGRMMLEFSDGREFVSITQTESPSFPPVGSRFDCLPTEGSALPVTRARHALAGATITAEFAASSAYDRDAYDGSGYLDEDGDCLNARHEALIDESTIAVTLTSSRCSVASGRWVDPYDGSVYSLASQVQIDHVVPLAHAHRAGAWAWSDETKRRFNSDLGLDATLVVAGGASNGSKGDQGPEAWKPPLRSAWCGYAIDWIDIKTRWQLRYRSVERDALNEMLDTCVDASVGDRLTKPDLARIETGSTSVPTPTTTTPPTTPEPNGDVVAITQCLRRAEVVTIANSGDRPVTLTGYRLHDEGNNHSFALDRITLDPGQSIDVLSGPDAVARAGAVVWTNQHVWNNDGDTAFVRGPNDQLIAEQRCS